MGVWGELLFGLVHKDVITLRAAGAIVDLFSRQQQHVALVVISVIPLDAANAHIVIGEDEKVEPDQQSGLRDFRVIFGAIRVRGVDVQVANVFVGSHRNTTRMYRDRNRSKRTASGG